MAFKPIKPFTTYTDQINNLVQWKNLIITDTNYAINKLHDIGYYSLIDGYKDIFYNPMNRKYEPNTQFSDIVELYNFDEALRSLVFRYICHIEQRLRSLISYAFCETYSVLQSDYLTPTNYQYTQKNRYGINALINILSHAATTNTDHDYVIYQRKTYGNVPLWVIMKTLTLGQTSKMYSFLPNSIQIKISSNYKHVNERELIQYLKVITHFRNICAHNERLFSTKVRPEIPDTNLHVKMHIPKNGTVYTYGKHDLFALLIAFRYLLEPSDFISFKKELTKLINAFGKNTSTAKKDKVLSAMGFPSNWNNITRYKL